MILNNLRHTTRGIANKGFRGIRRFVARFNFSCTLIGNRPQSLTGHTANVRGQLVKILIVRHSVPQPTVCRQKEV